MIYIERTPAFPLRRLVESLWYINGPPGEHGRQRMLPSGCAHIVLSLARDHLTECIESGPDRRASPALFVGQRSLYELVATSDFTGQAGVLFAPGAVPVLLSDRADLVSNCSLPLDALWSRHTDYLRSRMLESSSPQERLRILESCLLDFLGSRLTSSTWSPHPAVRFALRQFKQPLQPSIAELARQSGWSERRFSQVFQEQVGFTPKVWHRLQRFQRAVREIKAGSQTPWAELAIRYGYYDQAHFANEFRAFAGMNLTTYVTTQM